MMNKAGMAKPKAKKKTIKDPYGNDQTTGMSGSNTAGPKGYTYKRSAGGSMKKYKKGGMVGHNCLY